MIFWSFENTCLVGAMDCPGKSALTTYFCLSNKSAVPRLPVPITQANTFHFLLKIELCFV